VGIAGNKYGSRQMCKATAWGGGGQGRDGNVTGSSVVPFDRFQHMYEYCVRGSNPILLKLNII
jgi:hypothetical protein